jgi:acyl-coenzyme A synthetase/AMP-(fatty) acid ligase
VSEALTSALSAAPILEAVERYRGTLVDLDGPRTLSADEFAQARELLVGSLRRQGLSAGDRVAVALGNGPLFIATLTAVLACDASPLVLHYKTPPAEIGRYAERFGLQYLACEAELEPELDALASWTTDVAFGQYARLTWARLEMGDNAATGPTLRGVPLHPTSGSTGLPKIALRPGFAAIEEARHYVETMAIGPDDCVAAIPPMSHAYGYGMCVMVPLLSGASIVSTTRFSAGLIRRALDELPISVLPAVPAMLDMLTFGAVADMRSVRWALTAGSMLPRRNAERFHSKTGIVPCPLYGTTETGGISVATAADGRDVDGRVGPPMQGVAVEVRRPAGAADLGPGLGKLFVKSSSMMHGYLDDRGRVTTTPDGWFETGDLARLEDDGAIHLRGRDGDVVNVSGMKVVPCEVEEAIATLAGVREVKVYAGEYGSGDQIVKAAVAVDGDLTAADIRAHCERRLVYYKRPHIVTLLEALPRTPTGKIIPSQLP